MDPKLNHYGVNLVDEGINMFKSKINIEVQYASEPVIAAIERNGGTITTAYFDMKSVIALNNPLKFFQKGTFLVNWSNQVTKWFLLFVGEPIPKRELPTEDAFEYYSNAKNRGYLADPAEVELERKLLAQKYGYELPAKVEPLMTIRKDPRQIFYGLEPGWLINLRDKEILRPTNKEYIEFYQS